MHCTRDNLHLALNEKVLLWGSSALVGWFALLESFMDVLRSQYKLQ